MTEDEILHQTAQARADVDTAAYIESFKNYGMLLDSMNPLELCLEIGKAFRDPKQCAIIAVLLMRIEKLERMVAGNAE